MGSPLEQLAPAPTVLLAGLFAFARVFTIVLIVPFFGGRLLPLSVKLGLSIVIVAVMAPTLAPASPAVTLTSLEVFALLIKEAFLGAIIGLLTALVFYGATMAGAIIQGAHMGDPNAEADGPTVLRSLGYRDLYRLAAVVFFLVLGGHRMFLRALHRSFVLLPPSELPAGSLDAGHFIVLTGNMFLIAVTIALPILVALLIVDLGFGLFSRAARRVHTAGLELPIKVLVVVLVAAASLAAAVDLLMGGAAHVDGSLRHLLEQLGNGG